MIKEENPTTIFKIQEQIEPNSKLITRDDCQHHGNALSLFCESCEEPICNQCCIIGPHNNHLHRICQLNEAYEIRHQKLQDLINNQLNEKKNLLVTQIQKIEQQIEDVQQQKNKLVQVIQQEYQGIFDRLKQSQGEKIALLQNKINIIEKEINDINYLCNYYIDINKKCTQHKKTRNPEEIIKKNGEFIDFLLKSQKMNETIELMIQKEFNLDVDIDPDDLPRELTQRRVQLQKIQGLKNAIQFKDNVIIELINLKKKTELEVKQKYQKLADEELEQWSSQQDIFKDQLKYIKMNSQIIKKFAIFAVFNQVPQLQIQYVQQTANNSLKTVLYLIQIVQGLTIQQPDISQEGTTFHFFGKPDLNNTKDLKEPLEDQDFYEILLAKFRKILANQKNIDKLFIKHDKKKDDTVNLIQFQFIITELLQIDNGDLESILKLLDPKEQKIIKYKDFLKLLDDQNYLGEYIKNGKVKKDDQKK